MSLYVYFVGLSLDSQSHFVGETVHLQCGETSSQSPVLWYYQLQFTADAGSRYIISGNHLMDGDRHGRLEKNGTKLIITNVNTNDSGIYTCVDETNGQEVRYQVRLDIDGKYARYTVSREKRGSTGWAKK